MAGEVSQSWQKAKEKQRYILHGSEQESLCRGTPVYKTIRSCESYSLPWEQRGDPHPRFGYLHLASPLTPGDYYNSRWDLGGDTAKPYQIGSTVIPKIHHLSLDLQECTPLSHNQVRLDSALQKCCLSHACRLCMHSAIYLNMVSKDNRQE